VSSKQQWLITVQVDGMNLGVFDTKSGGDAMAKGNKHRPGGMGQEVSYASLASYSDLKLMRVAERQRDHELIRRLVSRAGRATASVTEQPLDPDGNVFGAPIIYTGRFLGVNPGDTDSTSEAPKMFELDIEVTSVS
jgi:hypothetical protein